MIRQKFERVGRANVMLVAAPRVACHFLDRVLSHANLAILDWPESFDPVVEQIIQPAAEAFGLLVSEIADIEGRILELPLKLRSARFPPARHQVVQAWPRRRIVVEPTEDLMRLQQELLDSVAPFTEKTGTPAAFASTEGGRDIQPGLIDYVANFVTVAAGKKFNPHVTIGVAPQTYLDKMFAEPFEAFAFAPVGAVVYQLGTFGTARKELQTFPLTR
jgi:hypothetical protein